MYWASCCCIVARRHGAHETAADRAESNRSPCDTICDMPWRTEFATP